MSKIVKGVKLEAGNKSQSILPRFQDISCGCEILQRLLNRATNMAVSDTESCHQGLCADDDIKVWQVVSTCSGQTCMNREGGWRCVSPVRRIVSGQRSCCKQTRGM